LIMLADGERWRVIEGDALAVLPAVDPASVALLLTDPPYGISERCDRKSRQRGALAACNDFPPIVGDDGPFDPSPLLRFRRLVLFGANHFASRLPPSPSWVIWDKRAGLTSKRGDAFNDNGDAEMAWTNLGGPVRIISHRWMGMLKDSERGERRVYPTQKPIAVMARIITDHSRPGDLILDPYCGSGTVGVACQWSDRRFLGIDIDPHWCLIARRRLGDPDALPPAGGLFAGLA
jgi:site-specific DNA-methyltransferase (adenine-specific)